MKIIRCLIVSEEVEESAVIESLINKMPLVSEIKKTPTFFSALELIKENRPDIIIYIVDKLNQNSFDFFQNAIPYSIPLILISASIDDAVESYNIGIPIDFLLKPVTPERLMVGISRAINQNLSFSGIRAADFGFFKVGRTYKKFLLDDIIYIEAYGVYSKIYTEKGKFTINDSIMKLEERLSKSNFIRVHKSYIINTTKIVTFRTSHFELTMGEIPIGANHKARLEGLLSMFKKTHLI